MSLNISDPAVPFGSLIVVSGAAGFIGSHVVDQLLAAKYRVRGTTRNAQKSAWEVEFFNRKYGPGKFELVEVKDMGVWGAFDEAVSGATGFVHVASDISFSDDPNVVITSTVNGVKNALTSAAKEAGMKRFVFTSSSAAATLPKPGKKFTITANSWDDEAVKNAWNGKTDGFSSYPFMVYSAGKTEGERAVWDWVKDNKPHFVVNTGKPGFNMPAVHGGTTMTDIAQS
jgi:nucleoside-diphosphate-sugar epimerase